MVVNLQTALIRETQLQSPSRVADPIILSKRLRVQYAAVAAGSFLSYILGGALFTYYDFTTICYLGIAYMITQIILSGIYLIQSRTIASNENVQPIDESIQGIDIKSIIYRLEALCIIEEEAFDAFQDDGDDIMRDDTLALTSKHAWRSDHTLMCALETLYQSFFDTPTGIEGMIDASHELRGKRSTMMLGRNRQTLVGNMAGYINRLMDRERKSGQVSQEDFVDYLGPRVFDLVHGSEENTSVEVIWPYMKVSLYVYHG